MRTQSLAALCLCLLATACTRAWDPQYGPVPQTAGAHQGRTVRVMMKGGDPPVEMRQMRVEGDSIVGEVGDPPQRYAVATADVELISVARSETSQPVKTGLSILGTVAMVVVLGIATLFITLLDAIP